MRSAVIVAVFAAALVGFFVGRATAPGPTSPDLPSPGLPSPGLPSPGLPSPPPAGRRSGSFADDGPKGPASTLPGEEVEESAGATGGPAGEIARLRRDLAAAVESKRALERRSGHYDFTDVERPEGRTPRERFAACPEFFLGNLGTEVEVLLEIVAEGVERGVLLERTDRELVLDLPPFGSLRLKSWNSRREFRLEVDLRANLTELEPFARGTRISLDFGGIRFLTAALSTTEESRFRPGFWIERRPAGERVAYQLIRLWRGDLLDGRIVKLDPEVGPILDRILDGIAGLRGR